MSNFQLIHGDCLDEMRKMEPNSVDTVLTDPPYGLEFMGKEWDHGVPGIPFWKAALNVAKPGAMLMAFGGTRTYHRLACAIEDAGWAIKDCVMYVYGSGFPKSHNIGKAIDKAAGAEREVVGVSPYSANRKSSVFSGINPCEIEEGERTITAPATEAAQLWDGWGTALKPAYEPVIVAMKPYEGTYANNALEWGVAGLWIEGGRVEIDNTREPRDYLSEPCTGDPNYGFERKGKILNRKGRQPFGKLMRETFTKGRWPANLIHDGSDEVLAEFPVTKTGSIKPHQQNSESDSFGMKGKYITGSHKGDTGTAARFFYCAKASRKERNAGLEGQNEHPTVKPLALMQYLARITRTPTGGIVLDPFMGSGTTGMAAAMEGRNFIGIEIDKTYYDIAVARIAKARQQIMMPL